MAQDLEFDDEERGLVLSAFYVGYWLTQSNNLNGKKKKKNRFNFGNFKF